MDKLLKFFVTQHTQATKRAIDKVQERITDKWYVDTYYDGKKENALQKIEELKKENQQFINEIYTMHYCEIYNKLNYILGY